MCLVRFETNKKNNEKKEKLKRRSKKENLKPNNILLDFVHLTHTHANTQTHVQRVFRYFTASFSIIFILADVVAFFGRLLTNF